MRRALLIVGGVALVAGLGVYLWSLEERVAKAEAALANVSIETSNSSNAIDTLQSDVADLSGSDVQEKLADLADDIEALKKEDRYLNKSDVDILDLIAHSASQPSSTSIVSIEKPPYCFAGDTVLWGYSGGFDC